MSLSDHLAKSGNIFFIRYSDKMLHCWRHCGVRTPNSLFTQVCFIAAERAQGNKKFFVQPTQKPKTCERGNNWQVQFTEMRFP